MTGNVLVTGGNGFIGSKLVEVLRRKGYKASIFDSSSGGVDLRNLADVVMAVSNVDTVFHLAAIADLNWARMYPLQTMKINIEGTWNVAYACKEACANLYYASTCCVYGNQKIHPATELSLPNPSEIYACSKLAGENIIKGFHHTYGLAYNMMRFATIYGEGTRPALATHIFMGQAIRGEPITVHGEGAQTRTLTHVDDLVAGIVALYESGKMNDVWNMTATEEISALKTAVDIKKVTGSSSPITFIEQRIGQTFKEQLSADKMKNEVGWKAEIPWEEGLRRMFKWFVKTDQVYNLFKEPGKTKEQEARK